MKQLVLFLIMLFMIGCTYKVKRLELKPLEKLSSPSVSLKIPNSFPKVLWEMFGSNYFNEDNKIYLTRHLPNMMSEDVRITVSIPPQSLNIDFLLDKKRSDDLERTRALPPTEWERKNLTERGVTYNKHYVDYISGLKCTTNAESSNIAMGVGHTKYYTVCGYYDVNGAKKRIDIFYNYTYTHSGTKFEADKISSTVSPQAMQAQFKQDMKAIFDSLVIHDMDRERMSKEGLLHDKKYDLESEFLSMSCSPNIKLIKGALIAAGDVDENGVFQDNANLNLKTDTLTLTNSTNSQYSSSNSYNVGSNIGYGTKPNTQTNVEETTGKVNSSSLSLLNQMGYSSSKVLATLGKGNLEVIDTENSDDLERFNRDTSKTNNELYEGNINSPVDATLDHRLLGEDGREQIAQDYGNMCQTQR